MHKDELLAANYRGALESLLLNLGWAIDASRPEGMFTSVQLYFLRRSIRRSYEVLGFSDKELDSGEYVWSRTREGAE